MQRDRTETIGFTVTVMEKRKIKEAARIEGLSISDFCRQSLVRAADAILRPKPLYLAEEDVVSPRR